GQDIVILDTAGRLHVDEKMMEELSAIKENVNPHEILLVVDAMTGQDAVNVAEKFDDVLGIDGISLTKLDGDARGGAALSIKAVTGKPIKFAGTGEKLADLEPFHPDRMSSRILGMGDMLSLIEKAEKSIDEEKAKKLEEKIRQNEFTLEDFLDQMDQVRNMGPLDQVLGMIPGMSGAKQLKNLQVDEKQLDHIEAIINSMTPEERRDPDILNASRRKRIARGSGTKIQEVNRLLKQFRQTKKMMKQFDKGKQPGPGKLNLPFMG
ncbi:MAG: signal recognition particle protein, partial [Halanaerobiales bacterium]